MDSSLLALTATQDSSSRECPRSLLPKLQDLQMITDATFFLTSPVGWSHDDRDPVTFSGASPLLEGRGHIFSGFFFNTELEADEQLNVAGILYAG